MVRWRMLLILVLLFSLSQLALAQEATPEATPETTPVAPFTPQLDVTLSDLGYDSISVQGAFGTSQIYLPIPLTWQAEADANVSLHLQPSPLLRDISSLTVYANNEPVVSVALGGGKPITADFAIPARLIKSPGIQLRFEAYLRVTDDTL